MSTPTLLGILNHDETVRSIYVHEGVGSVLDAIATHYITPEAIHALFDFGDASIIGNTVEPSELIKRFGFKGELVPAFSDLEHSEQQRLFDEHHSGQYSVFYNRDCGDTELVDAMNHQTIDDFINYTEGIKSHLFIPRVSQWIVLNDNEDNDEDNIWIL